MPYYNTPLRSSDLAGVISDCYEILGRRKTIDLLDTLNRIGFRQSTLSGLSFATDDLITPPNKSKIIANAEKGVMRIMKLYQRGIITEGERYNQVLDAWTHAREQITTEMMQELENDYRFTRLREPDLPDGPLRRPRRRRADSAVGRHARFDGQALGQDHRNADQGELPRGPDGAGVLQFHPRRPQGSGRYGPEDGRLGLPDPQAGRRGPERRGHHCTTAAPPKASPRA